MRPEPGSGTRGGDILRFLLAGGVNTAVTYVIYLVALWFVGYQLAYAICYAAGILLSYWLNLRFVFRETGDWNKLIRYPLVYAVQYGVGALLLEILVQAMNVLPSIAPIIVVLLTLPLTYLLSKYVLSAGGRKQP